MKKEEEIIHALKEGNVPPEGTSEICVGRDLEIEEIQRLFMNVEQGKAMTRFIEGDYGAGKSFLLKVIEEKAFEKNFVVSKITLNRDVPFNKFEEVYKNIARTLKCKTGVSLEHIINRWLSNLRMVAAGETDDLFKQNSMIIENMEMDLSGARKHANSFAVAIESYQEAISQKDSETANYAQAWLRGDPHIPFPVKRRFGVKGDVSRETAFSFLEALSSFLGAIEYSGLVILVDEVEFIRLLHSQKLRETAYDYIRYIYDECNQGNFEKTLFVFAATSELYDDQRRGIPSYRALYDRIKDALDTSYTDSRKPIMRLGGFKKEELKELSEKMLKLHSSVYGWDASALVTPYLDEIVDMHESAEFTGGKIMPRKYVRTFISFLDTIQQNPEDLDSKDEILGLFEKEEEEEEW